jgi:hypothetical protein
LVFDWFLILQQEEEAGFVEGFESNLLGWFLFFLVSRLMTEGVGERQDWAGFVCVSCLS